MAPIIKNHDDTNDVDGMHDEELMREVQMGNSRACEELTNRYEQPIYRYILYLTKNETLAKDLTQDTFIKACRFARSYSDKGRFRGWLYRVALNIVRDHERKEANRRRLLAKRQEGALASASRSEIAYDAKGLEKVLPPDVLQAAVLFYVKEETKTRIGEIMGTSRWAVLDLLRKAEKLLKEEGFGG